MSPSQWIQLLFSGLTSGAIYGLIGLGYVTIYRTSRVVNFAQGSFVMLGALIAFSLLNEAHLPYWAAGLGSVLAVMLISMVMYRVVIAPIIKVSLIAMILGTIGVSLVLENLALIRWGGYGQSLPAFTSGSFDIAGVILPKQSLWIISLTALILVGLYLLANRTFLGKQMTATASNPIAAETCGVYTNRMVLVAFAISAAIAAFSGIAISSINPVSYLSGGVFGLTGFVAAILGGWGSSTGAVVGGLTLGLVEAVAIGLLPAGYKGAVAFILLLLILYLRPSGILGRSAAEGES
ncbi:MAG: branched-chain amino acid ABC transporter permease [Thermoleophilia bacterium]|nr:branched-chain amino acid ABC transporter permease [Thermoleophilia bacterium]